MMKKAHLKKNVLLVALIGIMLYTLAFHIRYSQANVKMDDLMKIEALAPSAASQSLIRTLRKAVVHDLNYLNQIYYYVLYKEKTSYPVGKFRVIDGFIAALAVMLVYFVGSICCGKLTGIISAALLALTPPALWGEYAMRILMILINFELLIIAVSKNKTFNWILWCVATSLLFCTGVYAEAILLQSWLFTILIIIAFWLLISRNFPEWKKYIKLARDARRKRVKSLWKKIQGDSGFSRYIATAIFVGIIALALCFTGGFFLSSSILSIETLAFVILLSFLMVIIVSIILLALPMFQRERSIILDWLVDYKEAKYSKAPYETFRSLKKDVFLKIIFYYSIAMLIFLPIFFMFYKDINVFVDNFELHKIISFVNNSEKSFYYWMLLLLPVFFMIITLAAYLLQFISRGRLIGSIALVIAANIYILQQRYAVISTPFYIICSAGIAALLIEIIISIFIRKETETA